MAKPLVDPVRNPHRRAFVHALKVEEYLYFQCLKRWRVKLIWYVGKGHRREEIYFAARAMDNREKPDFSQETLAATQDRLA